MPVWIHHGPPGAFKTSGVVGADLIRWALEGRVVVTNVRGIEDADDFVNNYMRVYGRRRLFGKQPAAIPDSFDIIYLDTDVADQKKKMQEWFMWAPEGCAFLIDEIQTIYPQKMSKAEYAELGFKTLREAKEAGRPEDVFIAFEKHRHYNWDFVVTAPSIKKVPGIVKDITEVAYYHQNKGKIGLRGFYLEAMHHPDDSGRVESQWIAHSVKKADKRVFKLYGSTATGVATDTQSGMNIFKQPKVVAVAVMLVCMVAYLVSQGNPLDFAGGIEVDEVDMVEGEIPVPLLEREVVPGVARVAETQAVLNQERLAARQRRIAERIERNRSPLEGYYMQIGGEMFEKFVIVGKGEGAFDIGQHELLKLGYRIEVIADCMWKLRHISDEREIGCSSADADEGGEVLRPFERVRQAFNNDGTGGLSSSVVNNLQ